MASSETTLETNIITTEYIYPRGTPLYPGVAYFPVFSSLSNGVFGTHTISPLSTTFYSLFYGQSNFRNIQTEISLISTADGIAIGGLTANYENVSSFSNSTMNAYSTLSNLGPSTVSSFRSSLIFYSQLSARTSNDLFTFSNRSFPGLYFYYDTTSTPFNIVSSMIYPGELLLRTKGDTFYKNPTGSRFIGHGLSAISTTLALPLFSANVNTYYPALLSNTSSSVGKFQQSTVSTLAAISTFLPQAALLVETGSSISTTFARSISSLYRILTPVYGNNVSTVSTTVYRNYNNFRVGGTSTIQLVFSNSMTNTQTTFSNLTISTFGASSFLQAPLFVFSNATSLLYQSTLDVFGPKNPTPTLCTLNALNETIIVPFLTDISVSTNQKSYETLSSLVPLLFSTFSTNFPFILTSSLFYNLSIVNSNLSSLSSVVGSNYSEVYRSFNRFITGPGISSYTDFFNSTVSTNTDLYNSSLSTLDFTFTEAKFNVDARPGLSSISSIVDPTLSTQFFFNNFISTFTFSTFLGQQSNYLFGSNQFVSTSTTVHSNTSSFISTSQFFSTLSSYTILTSSFVDNAFRYISAAAEKTANPPQGYLIEMLINSTFATLPETTSSIIYPFVGSTIFFDRLPTPPDYSTSRLEYLVRSVSFENIDTKQFYGLSSINVGRLVVGQSTNVFDNKYNAEFFTPVKQSPVLNQNNTATVYSLVVGNTTGGLYTYSNQFPASTTLSRLFDLSFNALQTVYGTAIYNERFYVATASTNNYFFNIFPIDNGFIQPPFGSTNVQVLNYNSASNYFDSNRSAVYQQASQTLYISQFNDSIGSNTILYNQNPSDNFSVYRFPSRTDPRGGANFQTLGPLTAIATNGPTYLFTGVRDTFSNYTSLTGATWDPIIVNKFYTAAITTTPNLSNIQPRQISTLLYFGSNAFVTELNDVLWTGQNWVAVGDGIYTSRDGVSWTTRRPSTFFRGLRYTSVDTDGNEIYATFFSTSPLLLEVIKSPDGGSNWQSVSTMRLEPRTKGYTFRGGAPGFSTILYSAKIKWAYDQWHLLTSPADQRIIPVSSILNVSSNAGRTWVASTIETRILGNLDSLNIKLDTPYTVNPAIQMNNFAIYAQDAPNSNYNDHTMAIRFSSIIFNHGTLAIKRLYNNIIRGIIGINNLHTTLFTLDIGSGNARKPVGTLWITFSDERIKKDISDVDTPSILRCFKQIRLTNYDYTNEYISTHQVQNPHKQYGFISQEIGTVLPGAIYKDAKMGYPDFQSIDTDQILKIKYGVTRNLLLRASTLEGRIQSCFRDAVE